MEEKKRGRGRPPKTEAKAAETAEQKAPEIHPEQVTMITEREIEARAEKIANKMTEQKETTPAKLQAELEVLKLQTEIAAQRKKLNAVSGPEKLSIHEAILQVMKLTAGHVAKNGKNTYQNYTYAAAADVIAHVRDAVTAAGIVITPLPVTEKETEPLKNGTLLKFTAWYRMTGPDGSFIDVPIQTAGHDSLDKAAFKANTGGLKYLLINMFLLPTGDDPEANNPAERPAEKQSTNQRNTSPAPAPKAQPAPTPAAIAESPAEAAETAEKPTPNGRQFAQILTRIEKGEYNAEFKAKLKENYAFTKEQTAEIKKAVERFRATGTKPAASVEDLEAAKQSILDGVEPTGLLEARTWTAEQAALLEAMQKAFAEGMETGLTDSEVAQVVEYEITEAAPEYATAKQKEVIIRHLNNPVITRQEKTKMLLNINKLTPEKAEESIKKLLAVIEERESEQAPEPTPEPTQTPGEKQELTREEAEAAIKYYANDKLELADKLLAARTVPGTMQGPLLAARAEAKKRALAKPAEATDEPLANPEQKQILISLLNNAVINRSEKSETLVEVGQGITAANIEKIIANTKQLILERGGILPDNIK